MLKIRQSTVWCFVAVLLLCTGSSVAAGPEGEPGQHDLPQASAPEDCGDMVAEATAMAAGSQAARVILAQAATPMKRLTEPVGQEADGYSPPMLQVATHKAAYRLDEPITVSMANQGTESVYLLQGDATQAGVTVQRFEDGRWVLLGGAALDDPAGVHMIPPQGRVSLVVSPTVAQPSIQGPIIGKASPSVFEGDLRTLPPAPTPRLDQPAREVPLGILPSSSTGPTTAGMPGSALGPGTYRIQVRYLAGSAAESSQTACSNVFIITD
jgi:hypothetical protein